MRNRKSEGQRPSRLWHGWGKPGFSEEFSRPDKTFCQVNFKERSPINAVEKNSQGL